MTLLSLSWMAADPPGGGVSPLAWTIIGALVVVITIAIPAIWNRGNKIHDQLYADLKDCNEKRLKSEEDMLGMLKVVRIQMEQSRGGKRP